MKAIKVLVGLVFDDWRLVTTLLIGIIVALLLVAAHAALLGAIAFWIALPVSLWISTDAELKKKLKS